MQRTTTPISDYSRCAVCIGAAIATIGLYLTIVVPLVATGRLNYMIGFLVDFVQVIAVIIAVIASFPYMAKFYIYYNWKPKIHILYRGSLTISGRKLSKEVKLEPEFTFSGLNKKSLDTINKLREKGLLKTDHENLPPSMVWLKGEEILLFPNQVNGLGVELEPEMRMRVRLYPTVNLSEFEILFQIDLPRFFGNVELKPIERIIALDDNGNLLETNEQWLKKEYGTAEGLEIFRDG